MPSLNVVTESLLAASAQLPGDQPQGLAEHAQAAALTPAAEAWGLLVGRAETYRDQANDAVSDLRQGLSGAARAYVETDDAVAESTQAGE